MPEGINSTVSEGSGGLSWPLAHLGHTFHWCWWAMMDRLIAQVFYWLRHMLHTALPESQSLARPTAKVTAAYQMETRACSFPPVFQGEKHMNAGRKGKSAPTGTLSLRNLACWEPCWAHLPWSPRHSPRRQPRASPALLSCKTHSNHTHTPCTLQPLLLTQHGQQNANKQDSLLKNKT